MQNIKFLKELQVFCLIKRVLIKIWTLGFSRKLRICHPWLAFYPDNDRLKRVCFLTEMSTFQFIIVPPRSFPHLSYFSDSHRHFCFDTGISWFLMFSVQWLSMLWTYRFFSKLTFLYLNMASVYNNWESLWSSHYSFTELDIKSNLNSFLRKYQSYSVSVSPKHS